MPFFELSYLHTNNNMRSIICLLFIALIAASCAEKKKEEKSGEPLRQVVVPTFNGDSAYSFVAAQVAFGPRIPNTKAHQLTGDYFAKKLTSYGAAVVEQKFQAITYDGNRLNLRNIIASYAPEKKKRILLAAHWDTRPFADKDPENPNATFDGANDGASGVGILLEIARQLQKSQPAVGVDIIFFDGEDWGEKDGTTPLPEGLESWWCLGSQHWARNKHKKNYSAYYGILLDMVGSKRAHFYREGTSLEYAPRVVEKVWNAASRIGFSDYFVKQNAGAITDDHLFINQLAKIPMIDIVHYHPVLGYFGDYHHSRKDNLTLISKETLYAVGATVLDVVYHEEE